VTITKSLALTGVQNGNSALPVIAPPVSGLVMNATGLGTFGFAGARRLGAQILVTGGATVDFSNLALDGTNGVPNCLPDPNNVLVPVGIYFQRTSGSVTQVAFKNQTNTCAYPGQGGPQGDAVLIQNNASPMQSVAVQSSSFRNFGWMAIEASASLANALVKVTADGNSLVGPGGTNGNGIALFTFSTGTVTNNSVSDALRTGDTTGYWGIITQCANNVTISGNTIGNTDTAIAVYNNSFCPTGTVGNNSVTFNTGFDSRTAGVTVCGSGNTIQNNSLNDSAHAGADLLVDPTQGCTQTNNNMVNFNSIDGGCAAVLISNGTLGNTTTPNNVVNVQSIQVNGNSCSGGFGSEGLMPRKTLPGPPQP
jgi:hypothetical protein